MAQFQSVEIKTHVIGIHCSLCLHVFSLQEWGNVIVQALG